MKFNYLAATSILVCLLSSVVRAQECGVGTPQAVQACQVCHGSQGNSVVPSTPRLNGQQAGYILARLRDFLDVTRETPHATYAMWQTVQNLSEAEKSEIANYYARQTPTAPVPGSSASAGRQIYENGVAAQNIPACQSCHGARGEGKGAIPRLAGQHADYLKTQMWVFSFQLRENDVMHPNTKDMRGDQIDALASYLAAD